MFAKNVFSFQNFPVEEKERKWTDCCCTIVAAIFSLTMFIIACASWNRNHYLQVNYPTETSGKLCYYDLPSYPYVFFVDPHNPSGQRYCVSQCPGAGQQIQCASPAACTGTISSYSTAGIINRLGGICEPSSPSLQASFWSNPALSSKLDSIHMWEISNIALAISFCVGLVYMVLFIFAPKALTYAAFVLSALALLTAGILVLVQPIKFLAFNNYAWNIVIGVIMILVAIALVVFLFCYRQQIELGAIFLAESNQFLKDKFVLFVYLPVFIVLSFGLVVLCVWQFVAIGSANAPYWNPSLVYQQIKYSVVLMVLNVIEFIWGIQFVRDSFNYIIAGNAVEWYFTKNQNEQTSCSRPVSWFLCKNFGSVVGGSFLNAFLNILCIIFDLFRCDPKGKCGRAGKCCHEVCCCCTSIFDLSRPDAYAYIHLSGIPYCDAARQCEAICEQTNLFESDHTCIRLYRIAAQIFVVGLSALLTLIVFGAKTSYLSTFALAVTVMYCYLMSTHFADIHSNGAEGLVTCYLAEANCEGDNMDRCPRNLRSEVYNFEQKYHLYPEATI